MTDYLSAQFDKSGAPMVVIDKDASDQHEMVQMQVSMQPGSDHFNACRHSYFCWVSAALLQAEDRIHRVGQQSNCQVIQLIAKMAGGSNLDEIMIDLIGSKMARIGSVLDEDMPCPSQSPSSQHSQPTQVLH